MNVFKIFADILKFKNIMSLVEQNIKNYYGNHLLKIGIYIKS